jgi:hypothetical protein
MRECGSKAHREEEVMLDVKFASTRTTAAVSNVWRILIAAGLLLGNNVVLFY